MHWCKYSRSEKCPIKMIITNKNGEVLLRGSKHSDGCRFRNGRGAIVNYTEKVYARDERNGQRISVG